MSHNKFVTIKFEPYGIKSEFEKGTRLLDALKVAGLTVRSECGGKGICGKCRVIVKDSSKTVSVTEIEKERFSKPELDSGLRLACCSSVMHDTVVFIPEETRAITRKFLVEGAEKPVTVEPAIRSFYVTLNKPSLSDVRSDVQRLLDFLKDVYGLDITRVDYQLLKRLPEILRKAEWKATVTVWNDSEVISAECGDASREAYGIAIDIGTSKILGYFSNLVTGDLIDVGSLENPQVIHGEDVISRISFASTEDSLKEMQKLAVKGVNTVIQQVCEKSKVVTDRIYETTVVGNTAMHHLFLGIQPKYLGTSPYVPVISDSINVKAREISLCVNPNANVHVLPVIAGFVGADAVADIIATEIYKSNRLSLVIDIGTNTEIILGDKREMTACSCASGPAFEGAHLKCGMKAVTGAIERLQIDPKRDYQVKYQTVGNAKPIGICGSAIIDAVANLFRCRLIDRNGIFMKHSPTPRLRTTNRGKEFVLVFQNEGGKRDIVIRQRDIEQVQLAKAAIYAGCHILMKRKHVKPRDIKNVYVAGAFGNYLDVDNARLIGMLPDIPTKRIRFVGNAAGAGARMALISKRQRHIASRICQKTQYVELALDPDFQPEFTSAMFLPNKDSRRFPSFRFDRPLE